MGAPLDGDFVGRRGVVDYRPRGNAGQRAWWFQPNIRHTSNYQTRLSLGRYIYEASSSFL